jgi:hypothetical protein
MGTKSWLRFSVLVPALCLASLPLWAQQQQTGDPVADAARKAREDKKAAAKPRKVYTEDDIPQRGPDSPATQAPGDPNAATAVPGANPAPAGKSGDSPKGDEAAWRKRFQDHRGKIAQAEKELDVLQREAEKAQIQYYNDPQKALTEQYSRKDINEKDAQIAAKKQEIAQLKLGMDDLEDQLRKAGGDPGWAR